MSEYDFYYSDKHHRNSLSEERVNRPVLERSSSAEWENPDYDDDQPHFSRDPQNQVRRISDVNKYRRPQVKVSPTANSPLVPKERGRRYSRPRDDHPENKEKQEPKRHSIPVDDRVKETRNTDNHEEHHVKGQEVLRRHSFPTLEPGKDQNVPGKHLKGQKLEDPTHNSKGQGPVQGQDVPKARKKRPKGRRRGSKARRNSKAPRKNSKGQDDAPKLDSHSTEKDAQRRRSLPNLDQVKGQVNSRRHSYPDDEAVKAKEGHRKNSYPIEELEAGRRHSFPTEEQVKGHDAPRRHSIPTEEQVKGRRYSLPTEEQDKGHEAPRKHSIPTEQQDKDHEAPRKHSIPNEEQVKGRRHSFPADQVKEEQSLTSGQIANNRIFSKAPETRSSSSTSGTWESGSESEDKKKPSKVNAQLKATQSLPKIEQAESKKFTANLSNTSSKEVLVDDKDAWDKKVLDVYDLIKAHKIKKAAEIRAIRLREFEDEHKMENEPITPYWMIEVDKGPRYVEQMGLEFKAEQKEKRRKKKELDDKYARPRFTTYGTSGLSFHSAATQHSGEIPPFVSAGLGYLNGIDKLFLEDEVYIKDAILTCNSEVRNIYTLLNAHGHKVYVLTEVYKDRICGCFKRRATEVTAYGGDVVFTELLFSSRCCIRYKRYVEIFSPSSNYLGKVVQKWKIKPYFQIRNYRNRLVATIKLMKRCPCGSSFNKVFKIRNRKREKIGEIRGNAKDLVPYLYSRHYMYGIYFSNELDVVTKMLIMGGAALVYRACYDGYLPKKKLTHDPSDRARTYYQFENYLANHPSYMSSEATLLNWQFPSRELIKIRA